MFDIKFTDKNMNVFTYTTGPHINDENVAMELFKKYTDKHFSGEKVHIMQVKKII